MGMHGEIRKCFRRKKLQHIGRSIILALLGEFSAGLQVMQIVHQLSAPNVCRVAVNKDQVKADMLVMMAGRLVKRVWQLWKMGTCAASRG